MKFKRKVFKDDFLVRFQLEMRKTQNWLEKQIKSNQASNTFLMFGLFSSKGESKWFKASPAPSFLIRLYFRTQE